MDGNFHKFDTRRKKPFALRNLEGNLVGSFYIKTAYCDILLMDFPA